MSEKFSLISEYTAKGQDAKRLVENVEAENNSHKVKYQEYILEVNGNERSVYIPIRESESFETVLSNSTGVTSLELKQLLRDFRGIRNIG